MCQTVRPIENWLNLGTLFMTIVFHKLGKSTVSLIKSGIIQASQTIMSGIEYTKENRGCTMSAVRKAGIND